VRRGTLIALIPMMLGSVSAHAADIPNGRKVVDTWCQPCHAPSGAQHASDVAPPLAEIAKTQSVDAIRGFLAHPHGAMPDIQLSRQQIDDVTAYLESLKTPPR